MTNKLIKNLDTVAIPRGGALAHEEERLEKLIKRNAEFEKNFNVSEHSLGSIKYDSNPPTD